jgi:hypothetical protein
MNVMQMNSTASVKQIDEEEEACANIRHRASLPTLITITSAARGYYE